MSKLPANAGAVPSAAGRAASVTDEPFYYFLVVALMGQLFSGKARREIVDRQKRKKKRKKKKTGRQQPALAITWLWRNSCCLPIFVPFTISLLLLLMVEQICGTGVKNPSCLYCTSRQREGAIAGGLPVTKSQTNTTCHQDFFFYFFFFNFGWVVLEI